MHRYVTLSLIALLASLSLSAQTTPPTPPAPPPSDIAAATFCNGEYALCIKAPCEPIVSRDSDGNLTITGANCTCQVELGWSMGPDSCDARKPVKSDGRTYLISTYSNFYNKTDLTLTCETPSVWGWCYGAPCVINEDDPTKATCTCPVKTSAYKTLGGSCQQANCSGLWSAASYAQDFFANHYFFKFMTDNKLQPPPNPPARDCPPSK